MPNNQAIRRHYRYAMAVCARLRAFRTDAGFTASIVAEHLEIPTALYVLYEKYELVPHQVISPLCEFLNMSPWYYLTGMSEMPDIYAVRNVATVPDLEILDLSAPDIDKSAGFNPYDTGILRKKFGPKPR